MASWTDHSAAWLNEQIKAHPEMSKAELRRWCSKNYPFDARSGWAYKAWLKALRAYFNPDAPKPKKRRRTGDWSSPTPDELEQAGQQRLLG